MKVEIIRERRKTVVLKIVDGERAVLKAPKTLSDKKIEDFLQSKAIWIQKTANKLKENENFAENFDLDNFIYFDGEKSVPIQNIALGFEDLSKEKRNQAIKKYYLSNFEILVNLVKEISVQTGLKFRTIKPLSSVKMWGSFNSVGVVKLNWKLLLVPKRLAVYVICHELCHGLHMNHKPKFWAEVERICPNYKALKKELSRYSFLLKWEIR